MGAAKKSSIDLVNRPHNVFQYWCPIHEQQRFYSGCLYLVDAYFAGRISTKDPDSDCANAMQAGECAAHRMHGEEREAGETLYFVDPTAPVEGRTRQVAKDSTGYLAGWHKLDAANGGSPKPAAAPGKKPRKKRVVRKLPPE